MRHGALSILTTQTSMRRAPQGALVQRQNRNVKIRKLLLQQNRLSLIRSMRHPLYRPIEYDGFRIGVTPFQDRRIWSLFLNSSTVLSI